jgi:hypothetical protein
MGNKGNFCGDALVGFRISGLKGFSQNPSHKRSILKLQKKADFYRIPKAKIGWSFETLIMG